MILIIVIIVLALDQLTKFVAANTLILNNPACVIKGVFCFTLVHNRGAAFGILQNQTLLFIATSIIAIVLIYLNLKKSKACSWYNISLGLILSGAIGNFLDRIIFGYVIDFLDFRIWPVFNVADSAITVGAVLLGWHILISKDKSRGNN
ncbi:MAG: signal peptidase II [Candidatus Omnitrophica bacterium]|nr:signal peptidase II [Candidatus Omnitrophota bacterium]